MTRPKYEYKTLELIASRTDRVIEALNADHHQGWTFMPPCLEEGNLFVILRRQIGGTQQTPMEYFYHYGRLDRVSRDQRLCELGARGWYALPVSLDSIYVAVVFVREVGQVIVPEEDTHVEAG